MLCQSVLIGQQAPMQSESIRLDSMYRDANRIASLDITERDCLGSVRMALVVRVGCLVKPCRVGQSLRRIGIDPAVCQSSPHRSKTQQLDNNTRFKAWKSVASPTPRQVRCFVKAFWLVDKHQCKVNPSAWIPCTEMSIALHRSITPQKIASGPCAQSSL